MKNEKNIYIAHSHCDIMENSFTSYSTEVNKRNNGIKITTSCVGKWEGDLAQGIKATKHESKEKIFLNYPCSLIEINETICSGPVSRYYTCRIYKNKEQEIKISANNICYSDSEKETMKNTAKLNFIIALLEKESLSIRDVEDAESL